MPGIAETRALRAPPPGVERGQDDVCGFERVDAGERLGGVSRPAVDLDLEMQATVVGVDDAVGEPRADRQIGFGQALLDQPARTDLAARFFVVSDVQFDRAGELEARAFERHQRKGVARDV
jgi:hypothetical protein